MRCELIIASKEAEIQGEATAARLAQLLVLDSICAYISYQRRDFTLEKRFLIGEIMDDHYRELGRISMKYTLYREGNFL